MTVDDFKSRHGIGASGAHAWARVNAPSRIGWETPPERIPFRQWGVDDSPTSFHNIQSDSEGRIYLSEDSRIFRRELGGGWSIDTDFNLVDTSTSTKIVYGICFDTSGNLFAAVNIGSHCFCFRRLVGSSIWTRQANSVFQNGQSTGTSLVVLTDGRIYIHSVHRQGNTTLYTMWTTPNFATDFVSVPATDPFIASRPSQYNVLSRTAYQMGRFSNGDVYANTAIGIIRRSGTIWTEVWNDDDQDDLVTRAVYPLSTSNLPGEGRHVTVSPNGDYVFRGGANNEHYLVTYINTARSISIADDVNVASVTDVGRGHMRINYDTDLANDDYAPVIAGIDPGRAITPRVGLIQRGSLEVSAENDIGVSRLYSGLRNGTIQYIV